MAQDRTAAVIIGTGMSKFFDLERLEAVTTPYGKSYLGRLELSGKEVLFAVRHGPQYSVPPHKVNYRALVHSIHDAGGSVVLATNATGSMNKRMSPGDIVIPDQILDFTKGRHQTFFEGDGRVVFTDVTRPYSVYVREMLCDAAKRLKIKVHRKGTYVCTEGPRFETAAEIRMFSMLGGDLVGMTGAPEAFLAKELGMEYGGVCIVTNWAAGIAAQVSHDEVLEVMERTGPRVRDIINSTIDLIYRGR